MKDIGSCHVGANGSVSANIPGFPERGVRVHSARYSMGSECK
jgi:hypothetical protein